MFCSAKRQKSQSPSRSSWIYAVGRKPADAVRTCFKRVPKGQRSDILTAARPLEFRRFARISVPWVVASKGRPGLPKRRPDRRSKQRMLIVHCVAGRSGGAWSDTTLCQRVKAARKRCRFIRSATGQFMRLYLTASLLQVIQRWRACEIVTTCNNICAGSQTSRLISERQRSREVQNDTQSDVHGDLSFFPKSARLFI